MNYQWAKSGRIGPHTRRRQKPVRPRSPVRGRGWERQGAWEGWGYCGSELTVVACRSTSRSKTNENKHDGLQLNGHLGYLAPSSSSPGYDSPLRSRAICACVTRRVSGRFPATWHTWLLILSFCDTWWFNALKFWVHGPLDFPPFFWKIPCASTFF